MSPVPSPAGFVIHKLVNALPKWRQHGRRSESCGPQAVGRHIIRTQDTQLLAAHPGRAGPGLGVGVGVGVGGRGGVALARGSDASGSRLRFRSRPDKTR